jgi:hypothetical protein
MYQKGKITPNITKFDEIYFQLSLLYLVLRMIEIFSRIEHKLVESSTIGLKTPYS